MRNKMSIRYSASEGSKVKKASTLSIKQLQINSKRRIGSVSPIKKKREAKPEKKEDDLQITDYNVELDYQLHRRDLLSGVDLVLENQWNSPDIMNIKGLGAKIKLDIFKYRNNSPYLITINQLYTIFRNLGNTYVDKSLELQIRSLNLRKFTISNASPIISNNTTYTSKNITYGFENVELICKVEEYLKKIKDDISLLANTSSELTGQSSQKSKVSIQVESLKKFYHFVVEHPLKMYVTPTITPSSQKSNLNFENISELISFGYITLNSNHLQEIESHQYSISYPDSGTILKLINNGRRWLVKNLSKSKNSVVLESKLLDLWQGLDLKGNNKMNNYKPPFYGYDLKWILADALGAGIIDVFNTLVGRGWKLTGKL